VGGGPPRCDPRSAIPEKCAISAKFLVRTQKRLLEEFGCGSAALCPSDFALNLFFPIFLSSTFLSIFLPPIFLPALFSGGSAALCLCALALKSFGHHPSSVLAHSALLTAHLTGLRVTLRVALKRTQCSCGSLRVYGFLPPSGGSGLCGPRAFAPLR
jgi:hypothetical protein